MPNFNIGIIGAGPIGSIMAAYLAKNQEVVYLFDIKKELISAIEHDGITVTGTGENFTTRVKDTGDSVTLLNQFDIDLIFITVKFNFLGSLLGELKPILKPHQKILIVQNGIDNEDKAAEKIGHEKVLRFVINYAAMIVEPGTVKMSFFNPPNYIGTLSPENEALSQEIARLISEAGLETEFAPDIKKHEWKKTILNAALMPVCATTGLTMREAMATKETRYLCEQILAESIHVAKRAGYDFGNLFFENCIAYLSKAGHHKPSTLLDLEVGNPIEYIFQTIIDYGKKYGISTPFLKSLTLILRTLEKQKKETNL